MRESIRRALKNISVHGDTDIFPFPFERHVFHDMPEDCIEVIETFHADFEKQIATNRPTNIETLAPVGYTGFRWATQIEPFWNAYYLALSISAADEIEAARIGIDKQKVFSYRYRWSEEESKLFAPVSWSDYRRRSAELASEFSFVVVTDIADFYARIYHHRLENALKRLRVPGDVPARIMRFLQVCSGNDSYGLPVGGPASRILAELAIADVDRHLVSKGIEFCRYADDYSIFANSREEAYRSLVFLADKLFNEGLSLQKKKTRILSRDEFLETIGGLAPVENEPGVQSDEDKLLSISVRFDPYSLTAAEDYERLRDALHRIDIVGILGREVAKASIDPTVARQAISAVSVLDPPQKQGAVRTLLDTENIQVLAPVFISVLRLVREIYDELSPETKAYVDEFLIALYRDSSHLLSLELHQSYFVRAMATAPSAEKEQILVKMYELSTSPGVRREIILAMTHLGVIYWLRDVKHSFGTASEWERRVFLLASYWLGDEGKHWRKHLNDGFTPAQKLIKKWFSDRWRTNQTVPM